MKTESLPNKWSDAISFKDPVKDDKLGWIDPISRNSYGSAGGSQRTAMVSFKFLTAQDEPLAIKPVRTPWECFTIEDIFGKGRGKLTMRMQINENIWKSLDDLDNVFRAFLIKHRAKLFSQQDADFIGRDNSAIALKCKPLAPRTSEGLPMYDAFITVRVNGRTGEIDGLETKDGATGKFVSKVKWAARVTPLSVIATRFSIVVGWSIGTPSAKAMPIVKDTVLIEKADRAPGGQRVRYVGPGDIEAKSGCATRFACIRPAYWSLAPGGNASITLVLDSMVIDPGVGDLSTPLDSADRDAFVPPEGFAYAAPLELADEDEAPKSTLQSATSAFMASSSSSRQPAAAGAGGAGGGDEIWATTSFNSGARPSTSTSAPSAGLYSGFGAGPVPMSSAKRTKVEATDYSSPSPAPQRSNTGGAGGGVAAVRAIAQRSRTGRVFADEGDDGGAMPPLDMPDDQPVPRRIAFESGGAVASSSSSSSSGNAYLYSALQAQMQAQAERDALESMRHTSGAAYQCTQEDDDE
jgi:hypothetical protein